MMVLVSIAIFRCKPGNREALLHAVRQWLKSVEEEEVDGTYTKALHLSVNDPNTFCTYGRYRDRQAFEEQHLRSMAFQKLNQVKYLLADEIEFHTYIEDEECGFPCRHETKRNIVATNTDI